MRIKTESSSSGEERRERGLTLDEVIRLLKRLNPFYYPTNRENAVMSEEVKDWGSLEAVCEPLRMGATYYELRECDAAGAKLYRSVALSGVEMETDDATGKRTVKKLAGTVAVEALLVSLCLFENIGPEKDDKGIIVGPNRFRRVPLSQVEGWPERQVKKLHDRAKEISELDEREDLQAMERQLVQLQKRIEKVREERAKNEQGAGLTTSASPTN